MDNGVKQPPLLVISSPQKGDKVRFGSQVGKIIAFSEDKKRVQVDYVAFDGPAKKWLDVGEVRGFHEPVAIPSDAEADAEPHPKPLPEIKEGLPKLYKAGDVVKKMSEMGKATATRSDADAPPPPKSGEEKQDPNIIRVDEIVVKPIVKLKQIKVVEIGADGLAIPEGWSLHEVKSVFDAVHERMTHYAVIVQ